MDDARTADQGAVDEAATDVQTGPERWIHRLAPKTAFLADAERYLNASGSLSGDARIAHAAAAESAARRSIAFAPGNGYAWTALAWAAFLQGDVTASKAALEQSFRLAPNSGGLALMRTVLALHWWPELTPEERTRLLEEARLARIADRSSFIREMKRNARLRVLWRTIYEADRAGRGSG